MAPSTRSIRAAAVVSVLLLLPVRAHATFHISSISEVMSGFNGDPTVEYVEIRADAAFQGAVTNTRLTAFNADGSVATVLLLTPNNVVASAANSRILYATSAFQTLTGVTPDFIIPSGVISTPSGMICWGAPWQLIVPAPTWDETNPNNYIDCVAYGSYTGPTRSGPPAVGSSGTPTSLPPGDGTSALTRIANTSGSISNNSTDFALAAPGPCANGALGCHPAGCSNPSGFCAVLGSGCGNGNMDAGEQCDDGNLDNGDGCQANCTLTPNPTQTACRRGLIKASAKFAKAYTKALGGCDFTVLKTGTGSCPDAKAADKIAKAESKRDAAIGKACTGLTPTDAGFGASCPGLENMCTSTLATIPDVAGCMNCVLEKAGNQLEGDLYGSFAPMSPAQKCQLAIGKAVNKVFQAETKFFQKCEDGALAGTGPALCPDATATDAVSAAMVKEAKSICGACGGDDKMCDGNGDVAPADIGITTCRDVHVPAGPDCGNITITTLADLATCVDCIALFKSTCAIAIAAHPTDVPPECNEPTCTDGVKDGAETDVDCGGGTCPSCADGLACVANTDCTSNNCVANVCQP